MAMKQSKTVINCAVTGSIHIPSQSQHLPITPQQIIDEAVKSANAGAGTVHIHVRNPQTGQPSSDLGLFKEVLAEVNRRSNVVLCPTTGGGLGMTPEERVRVVAELKPELATCNMGSFNYGLFPLLDRFTEFKFDWEKKYLEMTRDFIFSNTFKSLEVFMKTFNDSGTKPEMECYDVGHLYNIAHMADRGFIKKPFFLHFIMGILGAIQPSIENLLHMKHVADGLFGEDYAWSVLAVGRYQFSYSTVAAVMGGNVRVGMEDNLYLSKGQLVRSNEESVKKIRRIIEDLSMEVATPDEVRKMLKLKGKEKTKF
ncbi:MAG TPA: 3-keto-5-aminohexanoate cleavage protein [Thermodesulfobacteriota bacterium]|nr:3-keto-5-aminohexanoate cleavage protein [Thermodesulfobacteriota bacterium]